MIRNRALPFAVATMLAAVAIAPPSASGAMPMQAAASARIVVSAAAATMPPPPAGIQHVDASWFEAARQAASRYPKADSHVASVLETDDSHGAVAALDTARAAGMAVTKNTVRVIVEASDAPAARAAVVASGAAVERTAGDLIQVLATPGQLRALLNVAAVHAVRPPLLHVEDAVSDEAVAASNASTWQQRGQSGAGVKVAIIDGGFAGYPAAQASGDLPASLTTVDDCEGGLTTATDHGTAVAEIVHKMAPAAQLFLICFGTEVDLGAAEAYATANGISIVNHSVSWYNSSRGDGSGGPGTADAIAKAALASGILWVNSAGNEAQAHWSGTFRDAGNGFNLFATNNIGNAFYLSNGETQCAALKWDDWPASSQDYDLGIVNGLGDVLAASVRMQTGTQTPTEDTCYTNTAGVAQWFYVVIAKESATRAPRFDLFLFGGNPLQYQVAAGSVTEPASSPAALAVGAACWSGTAIEPFSSRGPTIDGRIKPDLTGQDQVSTTVYGASGACAGITGFAGTSASAPHVAGAAALVKGAFPSYTAAQIQAYLQAQALDLGSAGKDSTFGSGLLRLPTIAFVPGAPSGVHGVGYNASALISWTAPSTDGGSAITGYSVTAAPGGATCSTSGSLSCVVPGLTNGQAYTFTVRATNAIGQGPASGPSSDVSPLPVPDPPTAVSAARGDTQVAVTWTAPADNGSAITGYTVTSSPDGRTCAWTSGPLTCTVTGLTNGQAYTFTIVATNAIGTGPASAASNSVTPAGLPSAPSGVAAIAGNLAALVSWTAPDSHGSAITGYTVTSSPDGHTCTTTGARSCVVGGLTNGTPYTFTVTATNDVGTGPASTATAPVTPVPVPDPPTGATAIASDGSAHVSWIAPASDGGSAITGYTATSAPDGRTCTTTGVVSCTVSGLTNHTPYTFTVTATNSTGTSLPSAPSVAVVPLPGATYVALTPARILDTRVANGLSGVFTAGTARTFQVTGRGGVPANAIAVTGNLTVTRQTASGDVALGPLATDHPTTSTLNFPRGDNRANGVTVTLGAGGTLSATYTASVRGATTALIFDVTGYFVPDATGATYVALTPARILDTRVANGLSGVFTAGTARTFQVTGRGGVPANAIAVTGNLTVTRQTASGDVALGPLATDHPTTSTLNFPRGDNRANGVTVTLGAGGTLSATYTASVRGATTALIFDVTGYFVP